MVIEAENKNARPELVITPTVDISGFKEYLKKCELRPETIKHYCRFISTISNHGYNLQYVTEEDVEQMNPSIGRDISNWMAAVRKYIQFLNGEHPYKLTWKRKPNLDAVGKFCMKIIRDRGSVTPKELRELCREKFPHYKIGRNTAGRALSEYVKNGAVHTWDSAKNRMVYGLKEYKKHNRNNCNMCGKTIKSGPKFCRECEPEALKIVEQCFPCPIPPDYPDRQEG